MTNLLKKTHYTLMMTLLALNLTSISMENPAHTKFNEIMLRPFNHEQYYPEVKIRLHPEAKIGYGDEDCINRLKLVNISADANSPLVPVLFMIPDLYNMKSQALKQIQAEQNEITNQTQQMLMYLSQNPSESSKVIPTSRNDFLLFNSKFNSRKNKMLKSAKEHHQELSPLREAVISLAQVKLLPIHYLLTDSKVWLNKAPFTFTEHQKLEVLKTNFEKQPDTLFFTIAPQIANKLNYTYGNDGQPFDNLNEEAHAEMIKEIDPKKTTLRLMEIIQRRPFQYDDWQTYPEKSIDNSNIIQHTSNYHRHGENGYSKELMRNTLLKNKLGEQRPFEFLNSRENGDKRRKINKDTHLTINSDINIVTTHSNDNQS